MASDWYYPRKDLTDVVMNALESGDTSAFLMFGRRRMGKTRFLLEDIKPAAQQKKWQILYVDFWEGTSPPATRLAYALQQNLYLSLAEVFPKIKGVTFGGLFSTELYENKSAKESAPDPYLALDDLIGAYIAQEPKRPTLFLFDEFQKSAAHKSGRLFLEQIRASLNKRPGRALAIFTGSSTEALQAIFDDRKGPFFDFATPLPFQPLDDGFVDHCLSKFERSTKRKLDRRALLDAFDELDRVTHNFRECLRFMMLDPDISVADAIARARERFVEDYRFADTWISLSDFDQAILMQLAKGNSTLYGKATAEVLKKQAALEKLPSRSKVQAALERLGRNDILIRQEDEKAWIFIDPEFLRWVKVTKL